MPREEWLEPNFMGKPMTMGGSGIVTTVDDYMRCARMLLGEGTLDGGRILRPATVRLMTTDQLDPAIAAVRTGPPLTPEEARGSVGEFYWDGFPSMLFWVDPLQDMAVVFSTQKVDFDGTSHRDIRAAVYGGDYPGR